MSFKGINAWPQLHPMWLTAGLIDDFIGLDTTQWNTTVTDSGTVAEDADGLNGIITLTPSDGTVADNDEAYIYLNETAKLAAEKPFLIGVRLQYAEAATNVANILFGMGEGFGVANTILDNGAGPPADYDGVCIYKVDGGTRWIFETSNGTTQQTTELAVTAGGSGYQSLVIVCQPISASECIATPWIDSSGGNAFTQPMPYSANFNPRPVAVQHRFSYSSVAEMAYCIGIKNGSTTLETLNVDLAVLQQKR